ncbi:MAG TPA: homoserine kinase [Thermotogota bacterium]|nr:homoserine kinase [Thermotogota bacterium]HRW34084.1 homoserine kinase [Thermotogota bacterium]
MSIVQAFGKATVANISCGFDILGFSVDSLYDIVKIHRTKDFMGVRLKVLNNHTISDNPDKNTAGFAAKEYLNKFQLTRQGVFIELEKRMPIGSGMGSSAASSVAALLAINTLFGNLATREELFQIGLSSEKMACGSAHGDNIAPSLYGGITLIQHSQPMRVISLPVPDSLFCLLIHPDVEVNTKNAREVLPENVPLALAVKQWSNIGSLVSGFFLNDLDMVKNSLTDYIVEPNRVDFIPYFSEMRTIALKHQAFNLSISGSGPTVFSLSDQEKSLQSVRKEIEQLLTSKRIACQTYLFKLNHHGSYANILEE